MRKSTYMPALAVGSVLAWAGLAQGLVIVNDSFDTYANQAAFEAVWAPVGTSGQLSTEQASSAPQSAKMPGSTTVTYRNRRTFAETGPISTTQQIIWSFDFWDNGTSLNPSPARNFSNLQDTTAPSGTNQLIAMGFNNNQSGSQSGGQYFMARILGYTVPTTADPDGGATESVGGSGAFFKLNDFGTGLRNATAGWRNLKVIISTDNGLSSDYEFYVDGVLAERVSNLSTAATYRSYDNIALGSGLTNAGVNAYYDNMYLEYTPEPATVGLLTLGGVLLRRRRRAA